MSIGVGVMARRGRAWVVAGLVLVSGAVPATPGGAQSAAPSPSSAAPAAAATESDAQVLRERAARFWAARMADDYNGQWELLEPRGRGRMTPQEYGAGRGSVRYIAYQVEDATVKGYFATVKVRVLFQPVLPSARRVGVKAAVLEDRWVRVGGVWYRRLDEEGEGGG